MLSIYPRHQTRVLDSRETENTKENVEKKKNEEIFTHLAPLSQLYCECKSHQFIIGHPISTMNKKRLSLEFKNYVQTILIRHFRDEKKGIYVS